MSDLVEKPKVKPVLKAKAKPKPKPVLKKAAADAVPKVTEACVDDLDDDLLSFPLLDLRKFSGQVDTETLNEGLVKMLDSLIQRATELKAGASTAAERGQQQRRITSFIRARDAIKKHKSKITMVSQAKAIDGVGKGIADRIGEYLRTGKLQELEDLVDPEAQIIIDLCTVTGIGEKTAQTLRDEHGVVSVDDLIDKFNRGVISVKKNVLTHHQAVGLKYYYDLKERMPYAEADKIAQIVHAVIGELDDGLVVQVCGSYRRKRPTCGDIDVLVSAPAASGEGAVASPLPSIVNALEKAGLLVGHLTTEGKTKYMGICKLSPEAVGRRIDIRYVPYESLGAAVLYFTGSGQFNKIMRYQANCRGYTLNEYGLYHYANGVKGEGVPAPTEEDIFRILNFVYLDPTEREF